MLYEIYCDKFTTKKDGQFVPRGRIRLHEALILYWATRQHRTL